jgi:hypothetical protein
MVTHDLYPEVAKYQPYKRGPRPASTKRDGNVVRILFAEVNGKLVTTGRLNGFVICDAAGKPLPIVFHQQIDPADGNAVLLHIGSAPLPAGASCRYGAGRDPYVNLNDELDIGTPVFGPLAIEIAGCRRWPGRPSPSPSRTRLTIRGVDMDAGAFLRERRVVLARHLRGRELRRVTVHELFHFVWWRLGNPARHSWEALLLAERARGESRLVRRMAQGCAVGGRPPPPHPPLARVRLRSLLRLRRRALGQPRAMHPGAALAARRRAWFQATLGGRPLSI